MTEDKVKIVCSSIPGFESIAIAECKSRLDLEAWIDIRGRISFDINIDDIIKLPQLCSVHHYWVVVQDIDEFVDKETLIKEDALSKFSHLPAQLNWNKALKTWKIFKLFKQSQVSNDENHANNKMKINAMEEECEKKSLKNLDPVSAGRDLSFRVTATRTGSHIFSSMESAVVLGAGVNELFNWKVDMTKFDIEVVALIKDNSLSIGIQLTRESQSVRNITHFGPTTLKPIIAYCLLELAGIEKGDIVCDPMCGGGSISVEGAMTFPSAYHICGDNHQQAIHCSFNNFKDICDSESKTGFFTLPYTVLQWDVYHLPLRTACVDRIVTDLPFGKRIGSKERNIFLYVKAMEEMARICRPKGRAVLLTQHKQAVWKALSSNEWWKVFDKRVIHMGGMNVTVFVLYRTKETYVPFTKDEVKL